jgi:hypothetical protein
LQWNDEPRQPILVIHLCICGWTMANGSNFAWLVVD